MPDILTTGRIYIRDLNGVFGEWHPVITKNGEPYYLSDPAHASDGTVLVPIDLRRDIIWDATEE